MIQRTDSLAVVIFQDDQGLCDHVCESYVYRQNLQRWLESIKDFTQVSQRLDVERGRMASESLRTIGVNKPGIR